MLGRYNAAVIEEALRATTTAPPFPSADDRPAWAAIGDRLGPAQVAEIVDRAEAAVQQPREVRQRWFRCGAGCLTLSGTVSIACQKSCERRWRRASYLWLTVRLASCRLGYAAGSTRCSVRSCATPTIVRPVSATNVAYCLMRSWRNERCRCGSPSWRPTTAAHAAPRERGPARNGRSHDRRAGDEQ